MRSLDISLLRTLVAVDQHGTFARAADHVGRSESAVSLQLKRLENLIGKPLFHRARRGMALTEAGQTLLGYAKRMIELNDEALTALPGKTTEGVVRLGAPADVAETWLPSVLARFARAYPLVRVDVAAGRSNAVFSQFKSGKLDLAVTFGEDWPESAGWSMALPMAWIGPKDYRRGNGELVRLAVLDPPCLFRNAAAVALDGKGIPWTAAFASPSLASLWGAVTAGLGITVRTPHGLPPQLTTLGAEAGLPALPETTLSLFEGGQTTTTAAADRLAEILIDTLEGTIGAAM
jgi:DNA-binding transcriptional LysR family regulator